MPHHAMLHWWDHELLPVACLPWVIGVAGHFDDDWQDISQVTLALAKHLKQDLSHCVQLTLELTVHNSLWGTHCAQLTLHTQRQGGRERGSRRKRKQEEAGRRGSRRKRKQEEEDSPFSLIWGAASIPIQRSTRLGLKVWNRFVVVVSSFSHVWTCLDICAQIAEKVPTTAWDK